MKNIEDCWGEKVSSILVRLNSDYIPSGNEVFVDEIAFVFEKSKIHILPIPDTDEISVECLDYDNPKGAELEENVTIFNQYIGKDLAQTWNCINANGYFDLYVIGFDQLHPSLLILSEGCVLKLFSIMQIRN